MDGRIIILRDIILSNLQQKWTVKELADSVGLSESHLQKLFTSKKRMSPIRYVQHLRFEKAKELLKDKRFLRIQQICSEIGINDQTHFTRDFKRKYNKTPTQYRNDYWDNYNVENRSG